jgi:hypothetical protein
MITVENLSFTYRKSKRAVLHDFSLRSNPAGYMDCWERWCGKISLLFDVRLVDSKKRHSDVSRYRLRVGCRLIAGYGLVPKNLSGLRFFGRYMS